MNTKLTRTQVKSLVTEALISELKSHPEKLTEEELNELLAGLKGLFGKGADAASKTTSAVTGAAKTAATNVGRAVGRKVGNAVEKVGTTAKNAAGAVKDAYMDAETAPAIEKSAGELEKAAAELAKKKQYVKGYQVKDAGGTEVDAEVMIDDTAKELNQTVAQLRTIAAQKKAGAREQGTRTATPPAAPVNESRIQEAETVLEILKRNGLA